MKLCWEEEVRAEEGGRDKALNEVGWTRSKHVLTWVTQEWKEGQGGGRKRGEGGKGGGAEGQTNMWAKRRSQWLPEPIQWAVSETHDRIRFLGIWCFAWCDPRQKMLHTESYT